ncbi:MAG: hypothetical protein IJ905_05325 [Fibrobacter sp.]|nr:hypothetical protein [Fibrobacter sp.]
MAFSLFSVIACADYEEDANDREDCLDNPNLPVCNDDEQQDEPAGTDTPSDNDI